MCGALEFAEKVSKSGTQPIIGSQINFYLENVHRKIIHYLAKSSQGYKNLIELSSKSYLESDEKSEPHCKIDELKNINQDLILLSGNLYGLLERYLNKIN